MKKRICFKIFFFTVLAFYAYGSIPFLSIAEAKGIKTSYKRYSIFKYKNEDVLCEPYIVKKNDWLYKIFRQKGEISEKDFPFFLIIFKEINPQISNIDAIEPGSHIRIPLKKVKKGDYDQSTPGNIDVPVIEFSTLPKYPDLSPFLMEHTIKKGEIISNLVDKEFLKKGGIISEEGLKAFQLANPGIKDINIVYEGDDIFLPDPSIISQSWFRSLLSEKTMQQEPVKKKQPAKHVKLEACELTQLKRYCSLIDGTLLNRGKLYFPGENDSNPFIDLASTPIIETQNGSKTLIISDKNANDELLKSVKTYWKNLKIKSISETIDTLDTLKNNRKTIQPKNIAAEYQTIIKTLMDQAGHEYIPNEKIPFTLHNIHLEASFGRVVKKDASDLLINFGTVYGAALEVLEKKEFKIISITPKLTMLELIGNLFSHLGYSTWKNPSFFTGESVESLNGLYADKKQDKLFIPVKPLSHNAISYLKKEDIKILSPKNTDLF
ncbi:hypothetical protein [Desulfobacula toluolica]|uniref:LysM domain protein n=1 Tax=Desulfobacula toluolica (strain DSM 7467 / Tol2) TaxID=651182 RepID=K0NG47_DESTT|nr:hypothetical protein [Desulfobacula toluolica]CCK78758.1 LysM domain protein [Desulfobacula toluolica Tol2]